MIRLIRPLIGVDKLATLLCKKLLAMVIEAVFVCIFSCRFCSDEDRPLSLARRLPRTAFFLGVARPLALGGARPWVARIPALV